MITVLIVDDHPVFLAGMRAVLDDLDDVSVVAVAGDGEEALAGVKGACTRRRPHGPAEPDA